MAERIEGILFDLGDTLLDFGDVDVMSVFRAGAERAYEYLKSIGQPVPSLSSYHSRQLWAIRWRCAVSRLIRREFDSSKVLSRVSRRMGQSLTGEQLDELSWCFYEPLSRHGTLADDTVETLQALRGAGVKMGIVSNTFLSGRILDRHLAQAGLLDLMEVRVYSSQVGWRKPDRRIFEAALDQADLSPARTLFVGDRPDIDVRGANRVGMISVLRDIGRMRRRRCTPRHTIHQISELGGLVARYNGG